MLATSLSDETLFKAAATLPTAARLLVELGQLLESVDAEIDEIAALLKQDPSLLGQILRMANSAAYSPAERIGSLEQAVAFLGFAEIHRLVGLVAAKQLADIRMRHYPVDAERLRQNTLFVAVLMEEMAKLAGESQRRCYTVGMLRPIGMMALDRITPIKTPVIPFARSTHSALDTWETENWGMSNPEAAEKILVNWKLPHETVISIRHHYFPQGKHNPIIHMLSLAATAAADRDFIVPGERDYWKPRPDTLTRAGIGPTRYRLAGEKAQRKFEQLRTAIS